MGTDLGHYIIVLPHQVLGSIQRMKNKLGIQLKHFLQSGSFFPIVERLADKVTFKKLI